MNSCFLVVFVRFPLTNSSYEYESLDIDIAAYTCRGLPPTGYVGSHCGTGATTDQILTSTCQNGLQCDTDYSGTAIVTCGSSGQFVYSGCNRESFTPSFHFENFHFVIFSSNLYGHNISSYSLHVQKHPTKVQPKRDDHRLQKRLDLCQWLLWHNLRCMPAKWEIRCWWMLWYGIHFNFYRT